MKESGKYARDTTKKEGDIRLLPLNKEVMTKLRHITNGKWRNSTTEKEGDDQGLRAKEKANTEVSG